MISSLHNVEAEEAVLGAALINPQVLIDIDLRFDDFYLHKHQMIWQAMQSLSQRKISPDMLTLTDELSKLGKLKEVGGAAYLAGLHNATPSSLRAEEYAGIVRDKAQRRRIVQISQTLVTAVHKGSGELAGEIANAVDQLTRDTRPKAAAQQFSVFLTQLFDDVTDRYNNPRDMWGIPTGFADYDKATGGGQPGEVLYIAGEPGIGKSILAMQMGVNMACKQVPGVIYSLEMREMQVSRRIVSAWAEIETRKLKSGRMEAEEWSKFSNAVDALATIPLWLSPEPNLTTTSLRSDIARLKARYDIKWFVVDYMFLMADGDGKMDDNTRTALLSRRIKAIANEFQLFGITVNSVTKEGMDTLGGTPGKRMLRGSGQVIHDADIVAFLVNHIPDKSKYERANENVRTFVFAKGREMENPTQYFHLTKMQHYPAFKDYKKETR